LQTTVFCANLKVRQPLAQVVVRTRTAEEEGALRRLQQFVLDELNVKTMSFTHAGGDLVDVVVFPYPKQLGQKYGKGYPKIKAAMAALDQLELAGRLQAGETVEIVGIREQTRSTVVTGVEMFRKILDEGQAGDNVGLLLRGIERTDVERGQVVAKPGSIKPHRKFMGEVYVLKKEEGGRHTPFFQGYRPQFYIRTMDITGTCELPAGVEMVMPGDNVNLKVELIHPVALEQGSRFAIREGGRTVGAGVLTQVLE